MIGQKELEQFREEMTTKAGDAYTVLLKDRKLPMALLTDNQKVSLSACERESIGILTSLQEIVLLHSLYRFMGRGCVCLLFWGPFLFEMKYRRKHQLEGPPSW